MAEQKISEIGVGAKTRTKIPGTVLKPKPHNLLQEWSA